MRAGKDGESRWLPDSTEQVKREALEASAYGPEAALFQGMKGQEKGLPLGHQIISGLISSCSSGATSEAQSDVSYQGHTDRLTNQVS